MSGLTRDDPLESVLRSAIEDVDGDKVTVDDILHLFGDRSFGPVVALLGLLVVLPPIGAIPVLPALVGFVIILFSAQIVMGRTHIWVPSFIAKRSISKEKLEQASKRARPWLRRIDNLISERLDFMTDRWSIYVAAIVVTLLSLTMIPLELIPFAVAAPGAAIMLFGIAFVARDGVLMLMGYAMAATAIGLTVFAVPWQKLFGG